jgi:hypothetical protein
LRIAERRNQKSAISNHQSAIGRFGLDRASPGVMSYVAPRDPDVDPDPQPLPPPVPMPEPMPDPPPTHPIIDPPPTDPPMKAVR